MHAAAMIHKKANLDPPLDVAAPRPVRDRPAGAGPRPKAQHRPDRPYTPSRLCRPPPVPRMLDRFPEQAWDSVSLPRPLRAASQARKQRPTSRALRARDPPSLDRKAFSAAASRQGTSAEGAASGISTSGGVHVGASGFSGVSSGATAVTSSKTVSFISGSASGSSSGAGRLRIGTRRSTDSTRGSVVRDVLVPAEAGPVRKVPG